MSTSKVEREKIMEILFTPCPLLCKKQAIKAVIPSMLAIWNSYSVARFEYNIKMRISWDGWLKCSSFISSFLFSIIHLRINILLWGEHPFKYFIKDFDVLFAQSTINLPSKKIHMALYFFIFLYFGICSANIKKYKIILNFYSI